MGKCASQFDLQLTHSLSVSVSLRTKFKRAKKESSISDLSNCLSTYYNRYNIIRLTQANSSSFGSSARPLGVGGYGDTTQKKDDDSYL